MWHAPFNSDVTELWHCFIDIFRANRLYSPEEDKCTKHITSEFATINQIVIMTYLSSRLRWRKTLRNFKKKTLPVLKPIPCEFRDEAAERVDYKRQVKSWERTDWDVQKLKNASSGLLDRQDKDPALSLRSYHWLKLTDAEHSRQPELTLSKSRFHSPQTTCIHVYTLGKHNNEINAFRALSDITCKGLLCAI